MGRIKKHIILDAPKSGKKIKFFFDGKELEAFDGEMLSSALFANGVKTFGYHARDGSPQGIFCANGQCAQCTLTVDGLPRKSCITRVREGMNVRPLKGIPRLPETGETIHPGESREIETDVLVIGAGPSGMSAAAELGKLGVKVIVVDDKHRPGGKLVLQTHKFFGSVEDCHAGTRGTDIAEKLHSEVRACPSVEIWTESVCLGIFADKKAGILRDGKYFIIRPKCAVTATGAREKSISFPGNTLPGVYGAGAFQTLANRDLIKPAEKLFVLGGGNVGLIAAYHALQAGITVTGLAEALPSVGGYKVHADKIIRLGVPIFTSHTVVSANGKGRLESVTIAKTDSSFRIMEGTEKTFPADTLLVAVGLSPVDEFSRQAREAELPFFSCGDAMEIAEASAAMFSGKIAAHRVLKELGIMTGDIPRFWEEKLLILKSRPGKTHGTNKIGGRKNGVYPVIRCVQEIPCNPCVTVCPKKSIKLDGDSIMGIPFFSGECVGCLKCLTICPGLAITVVDGRKDAENPFVYLPFEISEDIRAGDKAEFSDENGNSVGIFEIDKVINSKSDKMLIIRIRAPYEKADKIASVKLFSSPGKTARKDAANDEIICRCERVTRREIEEKIKRGIRDMNQLKAVTRAGMGACGGKTCGEIIRKMVKKHSDDDYADFTVRPPAVETPLGNFCNAGKREGEEDHWSDF